MRDLIVGFVVYKLVNILNWQINRILEKDTQTLLLKYIILLGLICAVIFYIVKNIQNNKGKDDRKK